MPRHVVQLALLCVLLTVAAPAAAQDELPPAAPITMGQLGPIDATLSALIPTEGEHPKAAEIRAAEAQCGALAAGDRLLNRFSSLCGAQLQTTRASQRLDTCDGRTACRMVFADIRSGIRRTLTAARRWNRLLAVVISQPRCVRALDLSPGELRSLRALDNAYALLSDAVGNRSERQLAEAEARFAKAGRPASAALVRRRVRADCVPVG